MDTTPDDFSGFFERYGWRFERRGGDLFRTGVQGDVGPWEIWIRVSDPWVHFTINPFFVRENGRPLNEAVHELVLRANYNLSMAKFSVDHDGDLALSVELPTESFSYSHFADALTAISLYADEYHPLFLATHEDDDVELTS